VTTYYKLFTSRKYNATFTEHRALGIVPRRRSTWTGVPETIRTVTERCPLRDRRCLEATVGQKGFWIESRRERFCLVAFVLYPAGRVKRNVAPCPDPSDSTQMRPPCRATIFLQVASPSPQPRSVTAVQTFHRLENESWCSGATPFPPFPLPRIAIRFQPGR